MGRPRWETVRLLYLALSMDSNICSMARLSPLRSSNIVGMIVSYLSIAVNGNDFIRKMASKPILIPAPVPLTAAVPVSQAPEMPTSLMFRMVAAPPSEDMSDPSDPCLLARREVLKCIPVPQHPRIPNDIMYPLWPRVPPDIFDLSLGPSKWRLVPPYIFAPFNQCSQLVDATVKVGPGSLRRLCGLIVGLIYAKIRMESDTRIEDFSFELRTPLVRAVAAGKKFAAAADVQPLERARFAKEVNAAFRLLQNLCGQSDIAGLPVRLVSRTRVPEHPTHKLMASSIRKARSRLGLLKRQAVR